MRLSRCGGVLLHVTSLPGQYGIGDLGAGAHQFLEWLAASGSKLWQILPLCPTGFGNSPYQGHSVFAGNPYLIGPDLLVQDGLLEVSDLQNLPNFARLLDGKVNHIDYERLIPSRLSLLDHAFRRFQGSGSDEMRDAFAAFRVENAYWLDDFALFMALKELHGGAPWFSWPDPLRLREAGAIAKARKSFQRAVGRFSFEQWIFQRQWSRLRSHARSLGVRIIGDVPIFVAEDSSDVWAQPELFLLNEIGRPAARSGVPPDYFSPAGQSWGNPLYRWDHHRNTGYAWWIQRLRATLALVDFVRLDHFRGFAAAWEIPAGADTAEYGRWSAGPAHEFLEAVAVGVHATPAAEGLPIIAEDLGVITPDVTRLRQRFELPGMRVVQFGFSGRDHSSLPHNFVEHCIAYTGTHDNDTARGWLESAPPEAMRFALRYLDTTARDFVRDLVRSVWSSAANFAIAPMQDLLDLSTESRMNYPGRTEGNWAWRLDVSDLDAALAERLLALNREWGR